MEPTTIIENAYSLVMDGQLSGFPSWADQDCFNIEARAEESPAIALDDAKHRNLLRLQSLLASRFQLSAHWESKREQGYALVIAKKGSKLKPSEPGSTRHTQQGRGSLLCSSCSVATLTQFLSNFVKKPVQNETGIEGLYDINLAFEPLDALPAPDSSLPSLLAVLQQELGLKLEPRKMAVPILVVDHIEQPSVN